MRHTVLILLGAALIASLPAISSQAIELKLHAKACSPACCTEPQCCEPQCCETDTCCKNHCHKPICPHCHGCSCMVVCEMKKVKKTVWTVEYKKFAPVNPGCNLFDVIKSKLGGCKKTGCCDPEGCCEETCGGDGCCGHGCCKSCTPPECGRARCIKKLVKKEITVEVPVYKCVVTGRRACCDDCRDGAAPADVPANAPKTTPAPVPSEEPPKATLRVPEFEKY